MGRIREKIEVNGEEFWTLFDSGARNTYITEEVAAKLPTFDLPKPNPVSLGGKVHNVVKYCNLVCIVEGYDIFTHARVLDEIGLDEEKNKIEVLIGALTMQEWGIRLNLQDEKIDMSHYPKEFIEF